MFDTKLVQTENCDEERDFLAATVSAGKTIDRGKKKLLFDSMEVVMQCFQHCVEGADDLSPKLMKTAQLIHEILVEK